MVFFKNVSAVADCVNALLNYVVCYLCSYGIIINLIFLDLLSLELLTLEIV